jgi:hypothetical protein
MRDSNVANAAKESAQTEFPHGLLDLCINDDARSAMSGISAEEVTGSQNEEESAMSVCRPGSAGPPSSAVGEGESA